jgi:tRNA G18 (ribose-2'-O)-methylase SpoU
MPWETLTSDDTAEARRAITDSRRMTDLIVVASLVDKVPNLAGLARTCEIFGAGSLVIGNKVRREGNVVGRRKRRGVVGGMGWENGRETGSKAVPRCHALSW